MAAHVKVAMSDQPQANLKYRPEVDGLRAIAVMSVFVYHLNHQWLPGGFIGVDIFFVISGYLITSGLYNDCQRGRFSLGRFYQRRIARIFPALFLVALATLGGAALVYSPQDFASAGANLVAAVLSLANVKYMFQGDYFTISPDAQPFLHYWSLSVEEQFYMLFPLLLLLIFRYARRHLPLVLGGLGLASLAACVVLTQTNPVWAFYLLPTRAWELCAGCLLAVSSFSTANDRGAAITRWLPAVGLFIIGCSLVLLREGSHFPGWQAIFPVIGTVALIWPRASLQGGVDTWLSSRSMVAIGKVSYSLYLWHWPVFSLVDYRFYLLPDGTRLVLKIGLSILLTMLTFHFIENPARSFLNRPQNRRIAYGWVVAVLVLCIPLGLTVRQNNYVNAEVADVVKGGLVFPGKPGARSVILMGDSNGSMYGKTMKDICAELGHDLTVLSVAAGDTLPPREGESGELWRATLDTVRKVRPDYLVFANYWSSKLQGDPGRLVEALATLKPHVGDIILLNQPPTLPPEASRAAIREGLRPPFREVTERRIKRLETNEFLHRMASDDVSVIDISRHFETENGEVLFLDDQGRQLFQDATHLSGYGAERIHGILKKALEPS